MTDKPKHFIKIKNIQNKYYFFVYNVLNLNYQKNIEANNIRNWMIGCKLFYKNERGFKLCLSI